MYEGMGGMMGGRGMPMSVMGPGGGGMMMDASAAWGIHHDSLPPDASYMGERSDLRPHPDDRERKREGERERQGKARAKARFVIFQQAGARYSWIDAD